MARTIRKYEEFSIEELNNGLFAKRSNDTISATSVEALVACGVGEILIDPCTEPSYYSAEAYKCLEQSNQFGQYANNSTEALNEQLRTIAKIKKAYNLKNDVYAFAMEGRVSDWFKKTWSVIKEAFRKMVQAISNFIKSITNWFGSLAFKKQEEFFSEHSAEISNGFNSGKYTLKCAPVKKMNPIKSLEYVIRIITTSSTVCNTLSMQFTQSAFQALSNPNNPEGYNNLLKAMSTSIDQYVAVFDAFATWFNNIPEGDEQPAPAQPQQGGDQAQANDNKANGGEKGGDNANANNKQADANAPAKQGIGKKLVAALKNMFSRKQRQQIESVKNEINKAIQDGITSGLARATQIIDNKVAELTGKPPANGQNKNQANNNTNNAAPANNKQAANANGAAAKKEIQNIFKIYEENLTKMLKMGSTKTVRAAIYGVEKPTPQDTKSNVFIKAYGGSLELLLGKGSGKITNAIVANGKKLLQASSIGLKGLDKLDGAITNTLMKTDKTSTQDQKSAHSEIITGIMRVSRTLRSLSSFNAGLLLTIQQEYIRQRSYAYKYSKMIIKGK